MPIYKCKECSHEHDLRSKPSECDICGAHNFKIIEEKKDLPVKTPIPPKEKPKKSIRPITSTKPSPPPSTVVRKRESIHRPKVPVSDPKPTYVRPTTSKKSSSPSYRSTIRLKRGDFWASIAITWLSIIGVTFRKLLFLLYGSIIRFKRDVLWTSSPLSIMVGLSTLIVVLIVGFITVEIFVKFK